MKNKKKDQNDIEAKIKAAAAKARRFAEARKSLLDIIIEITFGEIVTITPLITTAQKLLIKSPGRTPSVSNKRNGALPSRDATTMQASEEPETKNAKSNQLAS